MICNNCMQIKNENENCNCEIIGAKYIDRVTGCRMLINGTRCCKRIDTNNSIYFCKKHKNSSSNELEKIFDKFKKSK